MPHERHGRNPGRSRLGGSQWWIAEHKRYTGHRDVELVEWPDGWRPSDDNARTEIRQNETVGE